MSSALSWIDQLTSGNFQPSSRGWQNDVLEGWMEDQIQDGIHVVAKNSNNASTTFGHEIKGWGQPIHRL